MRIYNFLIILLLLLLFTIVSCESFGLGKKYDLSKTYGSLGDKSLNINFHDVSFYPEIDSTTVASSLENDPRNILNFIKNLDLKINFKEKDIISIHLYNLYPTKPTEYNFTSKDFQSMAVYYLKENHTHIDYYDLASGAKLVEAKISYPVCEVPQYFYKKRNTYTTGHNVYLNIYLKRKHLGEIESRMISSNIDKDSLILEARRFAIK